MLQQRVPAAGWHQRRNGKLPEAKRRLYFGRSVVHRATADGVTLTAPLVQTEFQPEVRPGFFTVKGKLTLQADPGLVWQVLTDYESSAAVFSSIQAVQVEARVDGRKQLLQKCGWHFLAFSGSFDCRLVVDEDAERWRLTFNLVESSFLRDFEGRWHVQRQPAQPDDTGESIGRDMQPGGDSCCCVVEHVLSVKPLMPVPPPFSTYTRSIFCKQVEAVLRDLQQEVQRLQEAQRTDAAAVLTDSGAGRAIPDLVIMSSLWTVL